jgi:hypothetical protein
MGTLSPWCNVFTDQELQNYAYSQDLSYYYGVGLGSSGPAKVLLLWFLESLITWLSKGPNQTSKNVDGTAFTVPNLIIAFLNDHQIAKMTSAMGIFGSEGVLPNNRIPSNHLYNTRHFIAMRGTVAFEALRCKKEG